MASITPAMDWCSLYASDDFKWQPITLDDRQVYYRHLGIVESLFDVDGIDYEGRADMGMHTTLKLKTRVTDAELRRRILLVWAYFRARHPLLACKSLHTADFLPADTGRLWKDKCFVYEKPHHRQAWIETASKHAVFLADSYPDLRLGDFYVHLNNTARAVDAKIALSKLFILPFQRHDHENLTLSIIIAAGHQIADGLTAFRWSMDFVNSLNLEEETLTTCIDSFCASEHDPTMSLPPPQEALYPKRSPTVPGERWAWAISRILRHVRHAPPPAFPNPLRRDAPLQTAAEMPRTYPEVLDYSRVPPLNTYTIGAVLPPRANRNLVRLCRQAGISIGSGAFTLVALVMMRIEEARTPDIPLWERAPFVGSFPVNPRPFLSGTPTTGKEDSLMLAFSDGVTIPFVSRDLDLEKSFRVLGRLAHRQLRQWQKRKRTAEEEVQLGSRSPSQLLPGLYLQTLEYLERKAKPEHRVGVSPQGAYPAQIGTGATCGISSVGNRAALFSGMQNGHPTATDLGAEFGDLSNSVRARDGEFLVGAIGTPEGMVFGVSYDGSMIDPEKVRTWHHSMNTILDYDLEVDGVGAKHAKL